MTTSNLTGDALVAAHKSATRNLRIVSIAFPIVFIAVIYVNLMSLVDQVRSVDMAAVGSHLSDRVNALMPDIETSLGDVADAVEPALFKSLETEALSMAPQIEKRLQTDVDATMANAKNELGNVARRTMDGKAEAHRAALVAAFPALQSDVAAQDRVLSAAAEAMVDWETRQLDATVAEHLVAMEQLHTTLQTSYKKADGAPIDAEDTLMTWLNLMNEHVGGEEAILASDTETKAKKPAAARAGKK